MARRAFGRDGYTMAEIIVVITVLGILGSIVVPVYGGLRRSSLENAATHHVRMVNAARESYALTIPSAHSRWASAEDDTAKLNLLIAENLLGGRAEDYLAMDGGYSVELSGVLRTKTILKKGGVTHAY